MSIRFGNRRDVSQPIRYCRSIYSINSVPVSFHVFPYRFVLENNTSPQLSFLVCNIQISRRGYGIWERVLYHQRWRKDIAAEDDCTTACSGDPLHPCGGSWRLQLYLWDSNLNT
ncbi:hypothetical protein EDB86DRAFT_3108031 [Lactarius hatsudake]|nr:hypothetical protein EDB86DRAFT_3108031 [Lactarius hatsudake]